MVPLTQIMTKDVYTVGRDTPMTDIADAMVRGGFGSAVVVTGSTLVGIITERDVLRAVAAGADVSNEKVGSWMTPDPVTASSEQDTGEAELTMISNGFRHLPVVDDGRLVGIVSLRDLFSARIGHT